MVSEAERPGPKPCITREVVERVSGRVGRGMPLKMALEAEAQAKINVETWHKHMAVARNEEHRAIYDSARAQFLDAAMARLAAADELKHLCWLLERRHSDLFGKQQPEVVVNNNLTIPEDVYNLAREFARREARAKEGKPDGK